RRRRAALRGGPRARLARRPPARDVDRRAARRPHPRRRRSAGHLQERARDRGSRSQGQERVNASGAAPGAPADTGDTSERGSDPEGIWITGLGLVTPLGKGVEATWERLVRGDRGMRRVTLFDVEGMRAGVAAEVDDAMLPLGTPGVAGAWSRTTAMA